MCAFLFALLAAVLVAASPVFPSSVACPPTPTPTPTPPPPLGCPLGAEAWECSDDDGIDFSNPHAVPQVWEAAFFPELYQPREYVAVDVPRVFVPRQSGVVVSTITVPDSFVANSFEVTMDITSNGASSPSIYLAGPDGELSEMYLLAYQSHGDLRATFSNAGALACSGSCQGVFRPYDALPVGMEIAGVWHLVVYYNWDEGSLNGWSFRIE